MTRYLASFHLTARQLTIILIVLPLTSIGATLLAYHFRRKNLITQ